MEKHFKRTLSSLDDIFAFVDEFLLTNGVGETVAFSTRLAVEELFTNLVRHNITDHDRVAISLDRQHNKLILTLKDFGVEPFELPGDRQVDVRKPLKDREIGGLGVHLVKNAVDSLRYEYADRTLCVTAIKSVEDEDV